MKKRGNGIGRLLSAGAVVVSLVFVAFEVRQNTVATRAQTLLDLSQAAREIQLHLSSNPTVAAAYFDIYQQAGSLARPGNAYAREDSLAAFMTLYALVRGLENVFLQADEGIVDPDVLNRYDFVSTTFSSSAFATFWSGNRRRFDPGFVRAFEAANSIGTP